MSYKFRRCGPVAQDMSDPGHAPSRVLQQADPHRAQVLRVPPAPGGPLLRGAVPGRRVQELQRAAGREAE